ncbi:MAG: hypothetical protein WBV93_03585, partial [Anaerobacillus sp.]
MPNSLTNPFFRRAERELHPFKEGGNPFSMHFPSDNDAVGAVDEVDETFSAGLSVDGWEYVPGGSYSHINDFIFQAEATATGPGLNTAFFENTIEIGNF